MDERYLLFVGIVEESKKLIWKERAGDVSLEQLYHEPIVPSAQKVHDLKEMALTHVPSPQ